MVKNRISPALCVTATLAVLIGAFGVSPAMATPKGEFAVFAQCPLGNLELSACIASKTESGEIALGSQAVPIVNTQTLQGGFIRTREGEGEAEVETLHFVGAANGETLTKTPQKVPGGLVGLVKCNEIKGKGVLESLARAACELVFENGVTGVNATAELAGPASSIVLNENNIFSQSGVGLVLPIKVKLENPLLGGECYIGSNSHPMTLELTSGTTSPKEPNKPITGKAGSNKTRAEGLILVISENSLVDNTFEAPGVTGCGGIFSSLLDPIINSKIGLPAASGHNTAILNNTVEQSSAVSVRENSEEP